MDIEHQIEQHRRYLARRAVARMAVALAAADHDAVPKRGDRAPRLLAWARAVEQAVHDLADAGDLRPHGLADASQTIPIRARYSRSAAYDVPLELDFRGTPLEALCLDCEQAPCVCEEGPSLDREYTEPSPRPASESDRAALAAAGYAPCVAERCHDPYWYLPQQLDAGRCAACAAAAAAEQKREQRRARRAIRVLSPARKEAQAREAAILERRIRLALEVVDNRPHPNERAALLRRVERRQRRLAQINVPLVA